MLCRMNFMVKFIVRNCVLIHSGLIFQDLRKNEFRKSETLRDIEAFFFFKLTLIYSCHSEDFFLNFQIESITARASLASLLYAVWMFV